jgi:hypothetical protein
MTTATMTDRSRRIPVAAIAGAVFCVVLIFLALQIRAGKDPALGTGQKSAATQPARQVIVRRLIVRRIVVEDGSDSRPREGATTTVAAPSGTRPAASAPAPAPAPARAPAPVVSRAS